ncbi:endo alpha-1,4 polygalactosaminidase [Streptomyces sp. NPDC017941]|uniref:endo alpha-1,4 polygalactosaminidase n=1 Tax=Streptomyces sp. NPDC017941 TaxID=3365018 RepID=UPI003797A47F
MLTHSPTRSISSTRSTRSTGASGATSPSRSSRVSRAARTSRASRPVTRAAARTVLALAAALAVLTGCSSGTESDRQPDQEPGKRSGAAEDTGAPRLPRPAMAFDYQLGGAYAPPGGVRAVSRDRAAKPAPGRYNICYVNAFQAQPGKKAAAWWNDKHPELVLRDDDGDPVIDEDWNEPLLDISTAAKREELLGVVGPWIDGCARAGFDAVEPDNLDSYARSEKLLDTDDAAAFARLLVRRAHDQGLAIAQKNTAELLDERVGFDFAVVEECGQYDECGDFASAYDRRVFDIEYEHKGHEAACRDWGGKLSVVLRDRDVRPAGEKGYVYRRC